jgi:hypothetical protein
MNAFRRRESPVTTVADRNINDVDLHDLTRAVGRPSDDEVGQVDAWWRAANFLTIGQIYL